MKRVAVVPALMLNCMPLCTHVHVLTMVTQKSTVVTLNRKLYYLATFEMIALQLKRKSNDSTIVVNARIKELLIYCSCSNQSSKTFPINKQGKIPPWKTTMLKCPPTWTNQQMKNGQH